MSQLTRRATLRLLAGAGAAGATASALSGCTDPSQQTVPVVPPESRLRIGTILPTQGVNQALGVEFGNGFRLYLNTTSTGLGGHPVQLVTIDEGDSPEAARAAVRQLIERETVIAVVGLSHPNLLPAVRELLERSEVPLLTASPVQVGLPDSAFLWRTGYVTDQPGRALGRWLAGRPTTGPVAVLAGETPGARDDVRGFVESLTGGGGTISGGPVFTPVGTQDFGSYLAALGGSSATTLFCLYSGAAAVGFVQQLRASGLMERIAVYSTGALTEGETLRQQGAAAQGIYTVANYAAGLNNAVNRRFVADYQQAFGQSPSPLAQAAYDIGVILHQAIPLAAGDLTPLGLNTALGRLGEIDSPRGRWQFSSTHSPVQRWYLRQVTSDGPVLANVLTAELMTMG